MNLMYRKRKPWLARFNYYLNEEMEESRMFSESRAFSKISFAVSFEDFMLKCN